MKIAILTYGSRGDVQPLVALAYALRQAGHEPLLAAPERTTSLAAAYNLPFISLPGDPGEFLQTLIDHAGGNLLRIMKTGRDFTFSLASQVIGGVRAACQDADLIVHTFLMTTGGHAIAREMGVADISAQFFPAFAPTSAFPAPVLPDLPLGGWYRRLTHHLLAQTYWRGQFGYDRLKRTNPAFPQHLYWPFRASSRPITPLLMAFSPLLVPRPTDWGDHIHITGSWHVPSQENWQPTEELAQFLATGTPPVCINFGSMVTRDADRIFQAVSRALARCGQRGLVLSGWRGWEPGKRSEDLLVIDSAPHDWLFSRVSAVVHHGGAGTTAAVLRAGVPSVIVPFTADQPFWARQVYQLGVSARPIPARNLTEHSLALAIETALQPERRVRAEGLASMLQNENGVLEAVKVIELTAEKFKPSW